MNGHYRLYLNFRSQSCKHLQAGNALRPAGIDLLHS